MNRVFFDANIINDIYDSKRRYARESYLSLKYCLENGVEAVTSCDIVTNVYYITAKYTGRYNALEALSDIESIFTILPFDNPILEQAIALMHRDADYHDLEDTIQYVLAKESGCDLIVSNDKAFVSKSLKLLNAGGFIAMTDA